MEMQRGFNWLGWPNCVRLASDALEVIVTTDVGPRILSFGAPAGDNVLYVAPHLMGQTGGDTWVNYGGHRLWHAPEDPVRTNQPDNGPLDLHERQDVNGLTWVDVVQPTERATGIQKTLSLALTEAGLWVRGALTNHNLWAVELALWHLTVMAPGGTAILPLPPRGEHPRELLPTTHLAIWPYTDLSDPRWTFGREFILLRQAEGDPQKIGARLDAPINWLAYANDGGLFVKYFPAHSAATYPDKNVTAETFTNQRMLELESFGPLAPLAPGETRTQDEFWTLHPAMDAPTNDAEVRERVLPLIAPPHHLKGL